MKYFTGFFKWVGGLFTHKAPDTAVVQSIQNAAVTACGFLPTASTVANILLVSQQPAVGMVTTIAAGICSAVTQVQPGAVTQMGLMSVPVPPTYNGVTIEGEFVK
jgi:hypothetical protein